MMIKEKSKAFIRKNFSGVRLIPLLKNILPYNIMDKLIGCSGGDEPEIYNKDGQKMVMVYISGTTSNNLSAGRAPKYILWNHTDKLLDVHFYGHRAIAEAKKDRNAEKKCLYLHESRAIIPKAYEYVLKHDELEKIFDYIFTSDKDILEKYDNARFKPASGLWYGTKLWGGRIADRYNLKTKNISILSSYKRRCELHRFRNDLAKYYKNKSCVDTYGTFDGGKNVDLCDVLDDYRYSIVIENEQTPYYFTEKILNCFAAMTVPIYIGATEIGKFFNIDGIIQIENPTIEEVEKQITRCNEEDYFSRKGAIMDNFHRVQEYLCPEDYIYEHYGREVFGL